MGKITKKLVLSIWLTFLSVVIADINEKKWWETASIYQIYPRSFKDSDGDGVGDLRGIMGQLPYLKEISATATWISPFCKSPMADFGYDISNATEIDPLFGTMEDFDALISRSKEVGVKIVMDFVPSYTSDESEWFIKSAAKDPEYIDFYVWHPGKLVDGERFPPTNWISVFRGSMWTWNEERQEYYLHQFHHKQPSLNYRNPKVLEAMKDVLRFWLRKGVAGFRVDAIAHSYVVAPDSTGNYPDAPLNPNESDPEDYNSQLHIYTLNQPECVELVFEFRKVLRQMDIELGGDERILLTEAYASIPITMQYYGNASVPGAQFPFNFQLITEIDADSDAYQYSNVINSWLKYMPEGRTANWVLGNHDQNRIGSRFGEDRIDMLNMLLLTLPGCGITYQGEEIGMTDADISWEDTVDPQGCQGTPEDLKRLSRDPERTPFQWSDDTFAGFTSGNTTWLPVNQNYKWVNVKRERNIPMSHLNVYKQLKNLRNERAFSHGDAEIKALSENVLGIKRWYEEDYVYVVLLNLMDDVESINLHATFGGLTATMQYIIVANSPRRVGDMAYTNSIVLMPKEAVVLRSTRD